MMRSTTGCDNRETERTVPVAGRWHSFLNGHHGVEDLLAVRFIL
jgi:hypothetical protein